MRRLLVFICAVILVDTMLYAALTPLLPVLRDQLDISKGQAGILFGSYALGTLLGALPAGAVVARVGPRPVLIGGLVIMTSAGVFFALADQILVLDIARFVQGIGGACSWTAGLAWLAREAPEGRRGAVLGTAIGMGVVGAQLGPVIGGIARSVGREGAFIVVSGLGLLLIVWALTFASPPQPATRGTTIRNALGDAPFRRAIWLTVIGSLAFGVVDVLTPLRLDDLGAGGLAISAVFFFAAAVEAIANPLTGRYADRHGVTQLVPAALLVAATALLVLSVPTSWVVLAVLIVLVFGAIGALWTPGGNLMSLSADRLGLDQGYAFALNNIGWSLGIGVGSSVGGALGEAAGDVVAYSLVALACLATAVSWRPNRRELPVPSSP